MKHHFIDLLDRTENYWTTIPNRDRFLYITDFEIKDKEEIKILTISKNQESAFWKQVFECPNLEELTLHEPSHEQVQSIDKLTGLKRLRLSFYRAKDLEFISKLRNLEELTFEYVSGFSDLSPLNNLKNLKSVHFENLRNVKDFSGLAGLNSLKYIYINGTLDCDQKIENFNFLNKLPNLEILAIGFGAKVVQPEYPVFKSLLNHCKIKKLRIGRGFCDLEDYAFVEVLLGKENITYANNKAVELFYENDGKIEFSGRGMRSISVKNSSDKCAKITQEYEKLKEKAKDYIFKNLSQAY